MKSNHIFTLPNSHYEKFQDGTVKCIEDEIPFEVPEGWGWSRLLPLTIKIGAGSTPTGGASVYSNVGIKFIRSQNVYDDGLVLTNIAYISEAINQKKSGSIVKPKDILLNITGGSIGRCSLVPDDFDIANVNQHVIIIRLVNPSLRNFIHKVIISPYIQSQIFSKQVGSGRGGLSAETLSAFLIPIPPQKEQIVIQKKLKNGLCYLLQIANEKKSIETLIETTRTKILDLAIRGQLVPQNPEDEPASILLERIRAEKEKLIKQGKIKRDKKESIIFKGDDNSYYEKIDDGTAKYIEDMIPFSIPEGWAWCRLGSIIDTIQYGLNNSSENSGTHRLLRITDIQDGIVNWDKVPFANTDEAEKYQLHINDIVFARTGATVGKSFLITELPYDSVYASYLIRIRLHRTILPKYIYQFFNSQCYWRQITKKAVGVGQPNCNGTSLKELLIPFPPLNEQKTILSKIDIIYKRLFKIEASLI